MVIFLQFALVDLRSLIGNENVLLTSPSWPSPFPHREFMRASGPIIPRNGRGIDNWIGENFICNIKKGIKIERKIFSEGIVNLNLRSTSKHQFSSEKYILTQYEFVFVSKEKKMDLNYLKIQQLISTILQTRIKIRNEYYKYTDSVFYQCSNALKKLHLITSTKKNQLNVPSQILLIKECSPQIFFYLNNHETITTNGRIISSIVGERTFPIKLYGFWYNYKNKALRVWVHKQESSYNNSNFDRTLRISFLRFHSEYESLKTIFKGINEGSIKINSFSHQSDILQEYLNRAISTILKTEENISANNPDALVEYFKNIFSLFQPGELTILKNKLLELKLRPQIEKKTINFIENHYMKVQQNVSGGNVQMNVQELKSGATSNITYHSNISGELNFKKLANEILLIKQELSINNVPTDDLNKDIIQLESAVQQKDGNKLLEKIKTCSQWLLDTGTKIAIPLIVEIVKNETIKKV